MTTTLTHRYTGTLTIIECPSCHMDFGATPEFVQELRRNHKSFDCPQGHSMSYSGESDIEKAERMLTNARERARYAEASASAARDQARATERSNAALKGHLTRARNKIAAGNCPVPDCGQHFANVREHMKHKHPDFHMIDPETGKVAAL